MAIKEKDLCVRQNYVRGWDLFLFWILVQVGEKRDIYDVVDEDAYSEIVRKRQEDDWVIDDGEVVEYRSWWFDDVLKCSENDDLLVHGLVSTLFSCALLFQVVMVMSTMAERYLMMTLRNNPSKVE